MLHMRVRDDFAKKFFYILSLCPSLSHKHTLTLSLFMSMSLYFSLFLGLTQSLSLSLILSLSLTNSLFLSLSYSFPHVIISLPSSLSQYCLTHCVFSELPNLQLNTKGMTNKATWYF